MNGYIHKKRICVVKSFDVSMGTLNDLTHNVCLNLCLLCYSIYACLPMSFHLVTWKYRYVSVWNNIICYVRYVSCNVLPRAKTVRNVPVPVPVQHPIFGCDVSKDVFSTLTLFPTKKVYMSWLVPCLLPKWEQKRCILYGMCYIR
jgi:hypothetical protein